MKRATQVDVARRAGVSRATVSYVLNDHTDGRVPISDETRRRVMRVIDELGYEPDARAQALRSGTTNALGLIIPDLSNPHYAEFAIGIEEQARTAGYHILLSSTELNEEYAVDMFKHLSRRRIDGLILASSFIGASKEAQETLDQLRKRRLPIVEMNGFYGVDCVVCNYLEATQEVIAYLLSLNHRRIGLIYGVRAPEVAEDRLLPYQELLRAAGLFDDELIVRCGPTSEDGYQAAQDLLRRTPPPTAVIAVNDLLALGVLRAAADLGLRIPKDVSVVGYDDVATSRYLVPRLTSVSRDARNLGCEAVKLLLARIEDPERPRQRITRSARLVIRESTGHAADQTDNNSIHGETRN
jgi:LacI family transcriptional regulator